MDAGDDHPEVERGHARRDPDAARREEIEEQLPLPGVDRAQLLDVALVAPRRDRRALDELLRRHPDRRPERLQRRDQLGIAGDEPRPVARHRRAFAQRVEREDVRQVPRLEDRGRRLAVEPELAVRLVGGEEHVARTAVVGGSPEEVQRRRRARRVVRVVQPQDRGAVPGGGVDRVQVGQEPVRLGEGQAGDVAAGEPRAPLGDRVARGRHGHEVLPSGGIEQRLREMEDRLLRTQRRQDVDVGVEAGAEAPIDPGGDRRTELRETGGARVRRGRPDRVLQGLADERRRLLPWIAHTEVDDRTSGRQRGGLPAVQLLERVRLRGSHPR